MEMMNYKLTAIEPTNEMISAGVSALVNQENPNKPINFVEIFKAMQQASPAIQEEPVAYLYFDSESGKFGLTFCYAEAINISEDEDMITALYAHTESKREPLSSDDIYDITRKYIEYNPNTDNGGVSEYNIESIIRDVEKVYGIGIVR